MSKLKPLISDAQNLDVALAYCFMKLEEGQHRALIGGLINLMKCDINYVWQSVAEEYFTRSHFEKLFQAVFNKDIPKAAAIAHTRASKIRNSLIHGKSVPASDLRSAISDSLSYMENLNSFTNKKAGFEPYRDLTGKFKSTGKLDKLTSYWLMKGAGLNDLRRPIRP